MSANWQTSVVFDQFIKSILNHLMTKHDVTDVSDVVFMKAIDRSIRCNSARKSTLFTINNDDIVSTYDIDLMWNGQSYGERKYLIDYDSVKSHLVNKQLAVLTLHVNDKILIMKCDKEIEQANKSIVDLESKVRLFMMTDYNKTESTSDNKQKDCKSYDIIKINE